ncbi:hypothethical protein (plasmid) [Ralstonia solanacearum PSI07]|nr:hypothethical protein [Ralstonia solanacearum PSI07]
MDSITVLSRLCLAWAKTQPQAFSERTGKPDTRGAYGLLGTEMIAALTHLQHVRDKHVVFVAILEEKVDEFNRRFFAIQLEGSKTALELPGVIDEVITLALLRPDAPADGEAAAAPAEPFRAFVTHTDNAWGYPAKDRSGRLDALEEPHLGKLIAKTGYLLATPDELEERNADARLQRQPAARPRGRSSCICGGRAGAHPGPAARPAGLGAGHPVSGWEEAAAQVRDRRRPGQPWRQPGNRARRREGRSVDGSRHG